MPRLKEITQKIYDLEKVLSKHISTAKVCDENLGIKSEELKVKAFDLLFSLSDEEQVELIQYRTHRRTNIRKIWNKHDTEQLHELARSLGHEDVYSLESWSIHQRWDYDTLDIDPNKKIDTGEMVRNFIKGGQHVPAGVTLKRHLDQLLNEEVSEGIKIIN